jgi:prepilin-type N-terminal cleavage/methylation domain-containing protein
MKTRSGHTLAELLVVLAILGMLAGIAVLSVRGASAIPESDAWEQAIRAAHRRSLASGRPITIVDTAGAVPRAATAFPDGRVVADR